MPTRPPVLKPRGVSSPAERDRERGSAAARGYGRRWQKVRAAFLAEFPVCAAAGCGQPATDVDHIVPHKGDFGLMWSRENLQPLCHSCHSAKTAREIFGRR